MTIRWRLSVLTLQLAVLAAGTYLATDAIVTSSTWFLAGVLSIVVNRQLLEPWFPSPSDVVANSIFGLVLYAIAEKTGNAAGWHAIAVVLTATLLVALTALLLGANRRSVSAAGRIGRAASILSRRATARFIYSLLFFVALLDEFPPPQDEFWILSGTWVIVIVLGSVNWRDAWSAAHGWPVQTRVEGLLGPSRLIISGSALPEAGREVVLSDGANETEGVVVTRILRPGDSWAEIHLDEPSAAERLLGVGTLAVAEVPKRDHETLGSVEKRSTHERLTFTTAHALEVGTTVAVGTQGGNANPVLYQISEAEVREVSIRGGSHLVVTATADQIGRFDPRTSRITMHRWVPPPGSPVTSYRANQQKYPVPDGSVIVGHVLGTDIPVLLDVDELCEGHVAILGMTKMGKTTLAVRLAEALAEKRRVIMVDQTGEYTGRRGLPEYDKDAPVDSVGLSVLNMPDGWIGADFALQFVKKIGEIAAVEYTSGSLNQRSIIFDEAHQFIPEPAGLGFNAPGRDSAYKLGYEFMQLRKYGISFILISQRTAVVAKGALSQCENVIAFRSVDRTGLEYLEQIAGPRVSRLLPTLRQGEALLIGPAFLTDSPVVVEVIERVDG